MSERRYFPYLPNTDDDRAEMLRAIGAKSVDDLFADIPAELREKATLNLPPALSEPELMRHLRSLAAQNIPLGELQDDLVPRPPSLVPFLGAGIYDHYIPSAVQHITSRNEFYTAYTPYQAEASQGTLQATFEYQSLICDLTGMEVSNASLYDGASALAEAVLMAHSINGRQKVLLPKTLHPHWTQVIKTYAAGMKLQFVEVPYLPDVGVSDVEFVRKQCDDQTCCVIVQHPNFFGCLEPVNELETMAHRVGALFIVAFDPISLGVLKPPGEYNADIAVAEGQSLGLPPSFGGPLLGIFTCKKEFIRKMPGRLVGETVDAKGQRGFVLTLQVREQHIRRERATSNICTNQALCAITAAAYLALMGKQGIRQVAELCTQKAHYLAEQLQNIGIPLLFNAPFFKEFAVKLPVDPKQLNKSLISKGFLGGLPLRRYYPELENGWLLAVTEKRTKTEMDAFVQAVKAFKLG
ncbi:putative glycine dehydrogenase (decarboxylating) subunit 1 [bacterium HR17]|uniref:Probable glycine dehydrogenase (decarboxylating) subunit 1 n=1 Tax=Candidatus Fervidibacter japonicus TaxID=2035412 RepID=A0A2H5XB69_9BACT|nr:putative glycine dehydrogenase (decarboxylating) subunit 1 [bacterium HR17]